MSLPDPDHLRRASTLASTLASRPHTGPTSPRRSPTGRRACAVLAGACLLVFASVSGASAAPAQGAAGLVSASAALGPTTSGAAPDGAGGGAGGSPAVPAARSAAPGAATAGTVAGNAPTAAGTGAGGTKLGQTPAALSWIHIKDSHGIPAWNYEMSIDRGGVLHPDKMFWSIVIDLFWQMYRSGVIVAIWLINWVLGFDWLPLVAAPVLGLSTSLHAVVDRFGLPPVLLTIAATVAVLQMAKGRWVLGIYELFLSLLVASLALGALADPVQAVAGRGGAIMGVRAFSLGITNELASNGTGTASAAQLQEQVTATLTDTFVRLPAEVLNFGTVIDASSCQHAYDTVVAAGPYGTGDDVRNAMADCDAALGDVAANPGPGQAASAGVIGPGAVLVLVFAVVLSGTVLLAGLYALYQSLKAIIVLVTGLLPGRGRGALWQTAADLATSLIVLAFSIVFLSAYLLLLKAVFASSAPGSGAMVTFFVVDILLVVGVIIFWRARRRLHDAADRLAQLLASRPGTSAAALPQKLPWNAQDVYYKTKMARQGLSTAVRAAHAAGEPAAAAAAGAARGVRGAAAAAARPIQDTGARLRFASSVFATPGQSGDPAGAGPTSGARGPRKPPPGGPEGPQASSPTPHAPPGPPGGAPVASATEPSARPLTRHLATRSAKAGSGQLVRMGSHAALASLTAGTSSAACAALAARSSGRALTAGRAARRLALTTRLSADPKLPAGRGDTQLPVGTAPTRVGPHGGPSRQARSAATAAQRRSRALPSATGPASAQATSPVPPSRSGAGDAGWERLVRDGQVVLTPHGGSAPPAAPARPAASPAPGLAGAAAGRRSGRPAPAAPTAPGSPADRLRAALDERRVPGAPATPAPAVLPVLPSARRPARRRAPDGQ